MKRLLLILLLACGSILAPVQAQAAPLSPAEEDAFAKAALFWGKQPEMCASLTREVVPVGSLGEGIDGRATMPVEDGAACQLWVVEGLAADRLCFVMRHEYAHLLGYAHEDPELASMPGCDLSSGASDGGRFDHAAWWLGLEEAQARDEVRLQRAYCKSLRKRPVRVRQRCARNLRRLITAKAYLLD